MLSARTKSSSRSSSASARRTRTRERSAAGVADQAGNARFGGVDGELDVGRLRGRDAGMDLAGRRVDVVEVRAVERLGRPAVDVVGEDRRHAVSERAWANRQASWNELYIGTGATRMMSGSRKSATTPAASSRSRRRAGVRQPQAELGAVGRGVARRDDLDAADRVDEAREVRRQPERLRAQGRHPDLVEDGDRGADRREGQDRRVGHPPAVRAELRIERLGHPEPRRERVPEPARQARHGRVLSRGGRLTKIWAIEPGPPHRYL